MRTQRDDRHEPVEWVGDREGENHLHALDDAADGLALLRERPLVEDGVRAAQQPLRDQPRRERR